jgi:hypothetical protein
MEPRTGYGSSRILIYFKNGKGAFIADKEKGLGQKWHPFETTMSSAEGVFFPV